METLMKQIREWRELKPNTRIAFGFVAENSGINSGEAGIFISGNPKDILRTLVGILEKDILLFCILRKAIEKARVTNRLCDDSKEPFISIIILRATFLLEAEIKLDVTRCINNLRRLSKESLLKLVNSKDEDFKRDMLGINQIVDTTTFKFEDGFIPNFMNPWK